MNPKKLICPVLALALATGLYAPSASASQFTDTVGHYAESAIHTFASLGIVQGYGNGQFDPTRPISRGDMCTILSRVFTYTNQAENIFIDLEESLWYAKPMLQLHAAGIIQGYGNGLIKPLNTITWEEALVMIARAFGFEETLDMDLPYEDRHLVSPWAIGRITALYAGGYLHANPLLNPQEPFTRADIVVILDSIISHLGWEAAGKKVVDGVLMDLSQEPGGEGSKPGGELEDNIPNEEPSNGGTESSGGETEIPEASKPPNSNYIETEGHNYPYDPNNYVAQDGRIYYIGDEVAPTYGIDVSTHQQKIDWQAVAGDGVQFAIIRLGYRGYGSAGTLNMDARFIENIEGALSVGLKVGVYFFSQSISVEEAIEEARFVLNALEPYRDYISLPVVYDWETVGTTTARTYNLDNDILNACALAFCGEIEAAGYQPMIYFYPNLGEKRYDLDLIDQYPFWYCDYRNIYPALERPFRIWQYSSTGSVAGIDGNVDLNICFWPY